jgi:hypothetical protein
MSFDKLPAILFVNNVIPPALTVIKDPSNAERPPPPPAKPLLLMILIVEPKKLTVEPFKTKAALFNT